MTEQDVEALAERLEETACWEIHREAATALRAQAAEIERLRAQNRSASTALKRLGEAYNDMQDRAEKAESAARTAYARGLEDAAKVVDEYAEHSRNQAEGKILAPVHEAIALRVSKRIRALSPDPSRAG